ncbi:hypothetical protein DNTS_033264 [Danionella cerebrum]|uniref:Cytochrome c oxidase subunit 7B, mitochondrial n=1 Tax=Danionella cerebrum TaxID=2873325 RepID=A0A553RL38_9TELE|nr:hypothetical protein DNTS_033264 [Danionella translucida]
MYRFAKAALNLSGQSARRVAVRQLHSPHEAFHRKYGFPLIIGGALFCTGTWTYLITSTGIYWNLSPVGRMQPMPYKREEED